MPIYEYQCESCGVRKEHIQKMNAAPLTTCPECSSERYVKLVSAAGFQLKGTGWYATDFKGGGSASKPTEKSEAPAPAAGCGGACACHPG